MAIRIRLTKVIEPRSGLMRSRDAEVAWERLADEFEHVKQRQDFAPVLDRKTFFVKTGGGINAGGDGWKATVLLPSATDLETMKDINMAIESAARGVPGDMQVDAVEESQMGRSVPQGKPLTSFIE